MGWARRGWWVGWGGLPGFAKTGDGGGRGKSQIWVGGWDLKNRFFRGVDPTRFWGVETTKSGGWVPVVGSGSSPESV